MNWHIITGEFPPAIGGVSQYVAGVAAALADAGDEVHIWCPSNSGAAEFPGIHVHRVADGWGRGGLDLVDRELSATPAPRRLLVQWVPHAFGRRSLNVTFCRWIQRRGRRGDVVDVMIHEPGLAFGEGGLRHNVAAFLHRRMAAMLLSEARRVWVAIPAWAPHLRRATGRRDLTFCWLPIPSTIPLSTDAMRARQVRCSLTTDEEAIVVGHFGTYNARLRQDLRALVPRLIERPQVHVLLLGRGSDAALEEHRRNSHAGALRIHAPGTLEPGALSAHLLSCDLMVQPYSDGVSTRRTTTMAALAHGRPVVTTFGRLSEPFWRQAEGVVTVGADDLPGLAQTALDLAGDPMRLQRMGAAARGLYESQFSMQRTVAALRSDSCAPC